MNEARQRLLTWLDNGAPGHTFDMTVGIQQTDCGTACCIAGFVALSKDPSLLPEEGDEGNWSDIREIALAELELPGETRFWSAGHPLFSSALAPQNCSPERAARAVRYAFSSPYHENPWSATD